MRQRKIKDIDKKISEYEHLTVENPAALKDKWREIFCDSDYDSDSEAGDMRQCRDKKLFVEIGCGKGKFIAAMGERHPEDLFVAAEGLPSVIYRAITKVAEADLKNVRFITEYINNICDFFEEGELDGIFMNFSDPWPKKRNYKRRLTYSGRMEQYSKALKPGGFIRFKTDNDLLFDFTLGQIEECAKDQGLKLNVLCRDLHNSEWAADSPVTEYEEKFSGAGEKINYLELRKE